MIRRKGGKFIVVSHTTGREFGTYDTKAEAVRRLRQVKGHGSPNPPRMLRRKSRG